MNYGKNLLILCSVLAFGAVALVTPALSLAEETASESAQTQDTTPTQDPTPTDKPDTSDCIPTDVKGHFNYTGDHMSGNPVTGLFENIASNPNCSDDIYVHVFGTNNIVPHVGNWLGSQQHVATHTFTIPQGESKSIEVSLPESDYCWYQVDATRTSEVRTPPTYHGTDMIDYVLVKNKECNDVTPTPTATPTQGPTATPTPGSSDGGSSENKTVESVQASINETTMAKTGTFTDFLMNGAFVTGMIVSALGALSYAKDKKASGAF